MIGRVIRHLAVQTPSNKKTGSPAIISTHVQPYNNEKEKSIKAKDMQKTKTPVTSNVIKEVEINDYDVIDNTSENPTLSTSFTLPFILQGEFFKITSKSTGQKIIAQCTNCPKIISGTRTSTENFVSHYNKFPIADIPDCPGPDCLLLRLHTRK
ncbi:uncharacterized protein LOC118646968 isoform X2 [Monomorium pharaonis]|uniref:uncharacterized protein LOC118646968 isoform X2 n=1 Tax=Monomorium pharaonis TaxID=307658 RepID=UPI001746550A|nr:uncharacterized protein LOC118646968 isoform X2 [Monomorium pharaonis]XP_036146864.1 uncharacterized protein LOC118646968 isoform X2 [Monomorium pharaonis]